MDIRHVVTHLLYCFFIVFFIYFIIASIKVEKILQEKDRTEILIKVAEKIAKEESKKKALGD